MLRLVFKNLFSHPVRSVLTIGSLAIAIFLMCFLASLVTALNAGVNQIGVRRLWTQSAISLFAQLPLNYEQRIEALPEIDSAAKFQWFGGYYQEQGNFFGQFAVDPAEVLALYPEMELVEGEGSYEDFLADRRSAIVGIATAQKYGFEVGETVPLIPTLFPNHPDPTAAWEFKVAAIYDADEPYIDRSAMFFHWDYFAETYEAAQGRAPECGTFVYTPAAGADLDAVSAAVDELFAGGPMRTQTVTESEFNRQFVGMIGGLPRLLGFLGFGVFVAILFAVVNTMLMASREQTHDIGVLKALGFSDGRVAGLMLAQSLALCVIGGVAGLVFSKFMEAGIRAGLASMFPGFRIEAGTMLLAFAVAAGLGLVAGFVPAVVARRLSPVEALRATV
jgi:putative ABC transport system permease protein